MIKRLEVPSEDSWRKQPLHWSATNVTGAFPHQVKIHEGNHSGEKSFICTKCGKRFSRSRDFQYHQRKEKDIKVSGAFPHHNSRKEWHWRKAIQVHEVWQELLMIKRLEEMIRGSMKETTNEVHQMWQELFHIRWRFMKGIAIKRSHSIAQSVHKVWQEIFRIKRLEVVPLEDPCRRETIQVHNLWQELFHIAWLKMAPQKIHQRIQKGKRQTPFKCTKCTPEWVNANILLGAVQKWCHLPRGRGVSQKLMW